MELVTGSLTGFGLFHYYFGGHVQDMYGLYICIVVSEALCNGQCVMVNPQSYLKFVFAGNDNHLDWAVCS